MYGKEYTGTGVFANFKVKILNFLSEYSKNWNSKNEGTFKFDFYKKNLKVLKESANFQIFANFKV